MKDPYELLAIARDLLTDMQELDDAQYLILEAFLGDWIEYEEALQQLHEEEEE
jgi:hypothetical protein